MAEAGGGRSNPSGPDGGAPKAGRVGGLPAPTRAAVSFSYGPARFSTHAPAGLGDGAAPIHDLGYSGRADQALAGGPAPADRVFGGRQTPPLPPPAAPVRLHPVRRAVHPAPGPRAIPGVDGGRLPSRPTHPRTPAQVSLVLGQGPDAHPSRRHPVPVLPRVLPLVPLGS